MMNTVEILMSTYNGESYLPMQMDSIFQQTYQDFKLTIRDDGSTDNTVSIIRQYAEKYPGKIKLLPNNGKNLGSTRSFEKLIKQATANYIMLCDQDDVWLKNKIELTLKKMQESETEYPNKPVMVFSDLIEVDSRLTVINRSFMKHQRLYPEVVKNPIKVLAMNVVAGCTTMFNKLCVSNILPFPSASVIHDHWMAINVAHYGQVSYLEKATILYRQHANNVVGANEVGFNYLFKKVLQPFKQLKLYRSIISHLDFRVNVFSLIFYKSWLNIKRILSPAATEANI